MTSRQAFIPLKQFAIFQRHAAATAKRSFTTTSQPLARAASDGRDPMELLDQKDWEFDDITSAGHDELDQHREARQYARIATYEMPMLARFITPFEMPTKSQIIRFRYTTYMGEKHPAESKVVMEFTTLDLGLSPVSERKLIKLCGPRYNPEKYVVRIACEMFETQAQNKRYLSDLLDKLLTEAKDTTDDFEDIPLDFRHHEKKFKMKPVFPVEWRMTKEKRVKLREARLAAMQKDNALPAGDEAPAATPAASPVAEGD